MLIRSLKIYGKMDLFWFLRDTKYCLMQIFADITSVLSIVIGIILLSTQLDGIGEFRKYQIFLMLGIATSVHGVYTLFFANYNNGAISRIIVRGQIDHYLLQPIPIWIQIITRGFAPFSGNSQFIISLILIIYSLWKLNILSFFILIKILFLVFCSLIIMVSFIYTISSLAFYIPIGIDEISETSLALFSNTNYFPLSQMEFKSKLFFTFFIPIGATAWLPTKFLIENRNTYIFFLIAVLYICMATYFMRRGLNYYGKKGARGYSSFGHR